jgi:hypothetical protein
MSLHPDVERLALLGWRLYPASSTTRAACFKEPSAHATTDLARLEEWSDRFPLCNWRAVPEGSGFWALDVDVPSPDHDADGVDALKGLIALHGAIPPRPTSKSGGGGYAIFFRWSGENLIGKTSSPAPGLDPRRGRLSITVPPSRHVRTRVPYRWIIPPWDLTPPPAPAWLLKLLEPPAEPAWRRFSDPGASYDRARSALYQATSKIMGAGEGTRNDTLNRQAYRVGTYVAAGKLSEHEAAEMLFGAARQAGLDRPSIIATIKSAFHAARRAPKVGA